MKGLKCACAGNLKDKHDQYSISYRDVLSAALYPKVFNQFKCARTPRLASNTLVHALSASSRHAVTCHSCLSAPLGMDLAKGYLYI